MSTVIFAVMCALLGAWIAASTAARRDRSRARARNEHGQLLRVDSAATQAQIDRLMTAFAGHLEERGVSPGDDLPQIFADWLADLTGSTVVARQVDGDGLVIAIPGRIPEEEE